MIIHNCPNCNIGVLVKANGKCPGCGLVLDSHLAVEADADSEGTPTPWEPLKTARTDDPPEDATEEPDSGIWAEFKSSPLVGAICPYLILLAVTSPIMLLGGEKVVFNVGSICVLSSVVMRRFIKTGWSVGPGYDLLPVSPHFSAQFKKHSIAIALACVLVVIWLIVDDGSTSFDPQPK